MQKNVILFYDGFGMDMRGLAIIYLKALAELGYKIIYVTNARAKGKQPMLFSVLQPYEVDVRYFTYAKGYSDQLDFCWISLKRKDHSAPLFIQDQKMSLLLWHLSCVIFQSVI